MESWKARTAGTGQEWKILLMGQVVGGLKSIHMFCNTKVINYVSGNNQGRVKVAKWEWEEMRQSEKAEKILETFGHGEEGEDAGWASGFPASVHSLALALTV